MVATFLAVLELIKAKRLKSEGNGEYMNLELARREKV